MHFAEGAGEHYVCLEDTVSPEIEQPGDYLTDTEEGLQTEDEIPGNHVNHTSDVIVEDQEHQQNATTDNGNVNDIVIGQQHQPTVSTANCNDNDEGGSYLNCDVLEHIIKKVLKCIQACAHHSVK